jgi:cyclic pyranopterin phosphate synthase
MYCMPEEGVGFIPPAQILSYEEILRLTDLFLELGVEKIRLTGGEPLIRKNIGFLLSGMGRKKGIRELALTTNGTMLADFCRDVMAAGVRRVNVSLDTLHPGMFRRITGRDLYARVEMGIRAAAEAGLRIKVNVVVMKGVNDGEVGDFVRYGIDNCVDVCFIELMPHCSNREISQNLFFPRREILRRVKNVCSLTPVRRENRRTTAEVYDVDGAGITVGFISAVSRPFCDSCNRIRLTPEGTLRTCLYGAASVDLKKLLRSGASDAVIRDRIRRAVRAKQARCDLREGRENLLMNRVGG